MSTINKDEINKFSKIADEWWDIDGKFKPLHMFNPIRIEHILDIALNYFKINKDKEFPFKNLKILDIGCGGGLISEPMSRLGADVTGIDASNKNIYGTTTPEERLELEEEGIELASIPWAKDKEN